jgi:hypothetical protein
LGQDVDELEAEKDRFIWELDILGQQQSELEQTVQPWRSSWDWDRAVDSHRLAY